MGREDVNIRVNSNVAEALRLWQAMEAGPKAMAASLEGMGNRGRQASRGMGDELQRMLGRWLSIGAAISAATSLIHHLIAAHSKLRQETKEASTGIDTSLREVYNLMEQTRSGGELRKRILGTAAERGVTPGKAFEATAALSGAGYTPEQVLEGGGLDTVLRIMAANAATGNDVDTKTLVDSLTAFLDATRQDKTSENLMQAGVAMQNLWAQTKLSIEDLNVIASRSAAIHGATGLGNEQLAVMSMFRDVTDPSTGATAFRGGVLKLQNASNNKKRAALLAELGLSPEDVDFQGEDFIEVLKRLNKGRKERGPDAAAAAAGIFGEESILFYNTLVNDEGIAELERRMKMQGDVGGFERARKVSEGSLQAKSDAAEARKTQAYYDEQFIDPETVRKNFLAQLQQEGHGGVSQYFKEKVYQTNILTGATPEEALLGAMGEGHAVVQAGGARQAIGQMDPGQRKFYEDILSASAPENNLGGRGGPVDVNVKVQLVDQNNQRMPHRAEVHNVGKNSASKRGR